MKEKLYSDLSLFFDVPKNVLLEDGITLHSIMEKSSNAINSVDVMEGFAVVLQKNELEDIVDVPVFTLDDTLSEVIDSLVNQINKGVTL